MEHKKINLRKYLKEQLQSYQTVAVERTTKVLTRMGFELSIARQVLESISWAVCDLK